MDLLVMRRLDIHGEEQFAITKNGVTVCAYTSNDAKVYETLIQTIKKGGLSDSDVIGFFNVESQETKYKRVGECLPKGT
jgi:hypothetical protein